MPGSFLPSMSSRDAPPPVEMCFIFAATSLSRRVDRRRAVSAADDGERLRRRRSRGRPRTSPPRTAPSRRGPSGRSRRSSSRPRSASRRARRSSARCRAPSRPPGPRRPRPSCRWRRPVLAATTTSTGSSTLDAAVARLLEDRPRERQLVGLDERGLHVLPLRREERVGHRAADDERRRPARGATRRPRSCRCTFAPPSTATYGLSGAVTILPSAAISFSRRNPQPRSR